MYEILSNKWRPKVLADIVGQDEIVYSIKSILQNKYVPHSFILSGSHGVGKTSLARIIIKCLNCEIGITTKPCNECYCCKSIENLNNPDSLEIDAASKTTVESIKELISVTDYQTFKNRFRTYIIDECHMLSLNSFNFLLKILEEEKQNNIYILVTTNINKIPDTVKSRCVTFELRKLQGKHIRGRLYEIMKEEGYIFTESVLDKILLFSDGSMRKIINILEKFGYEKNLSDKSVESILELSSDGDILLLIDSIFKNDFLKTISLTKFLSCTTVKIENVVIQIQLVLYKIFLYKLKIKYDNKLSNNFMHICYNVDFNKIRSFFEIILKGKIYLKLAPNEEIAFEMLVIHIFLNVNKLKF